MNKICVVYTHGKLGDLIWQLPYIKAISDFHNQKITLISRPTTHAKILYKDLNYIDEIIYNDFRKKIYYLIELIKLWIIFKNKKFSHVYLLDKVNRPAVAAKLAGIKNIIGVGIGNQKKWLTNKIFLSEDDQKLTYSEQSQKFCRINNIKVDSFYPEIIIKKERLNSLNMNPYKSKYFKVAFCVDSAEEYKIWPEEYFSILAKMLYENNLGDLFFLISHPKNKSYVDKIISLTDRNYFVDCSNINLLEMCKVILDSKFLVGNNTGPTNLAAALNVKSYNLISSTSLKENKFSKIIPVLPDDYIDPINKTIKKVGDTFVKSREEMKKITPQKVFAKIYDIFVNDLILEKNILLSKSTIQKCLTESISRIDESLMLPIRWSLVGLILRGGWLFGKNKESFGHNGWGGSLGFADPILGIGVAYTTNKINPTMASDQRIINLLKKFYEII